MKLIRRLRDYVARNNACLDSEFNMEVRIGLLNRVGEIVNTPNGVREIDPEDLRIMLKLLSVLLAENVLKDLEES